MTNISARDNSENTSAIGLHARSALVEAYLADDRPWVVAFSGGKDSTCVLQLVIEMLSVIRSPKKPIYVISSDTRVEAPNVVAYVERVLQAVRHYAGEHALPIYTKIVRPNVDQTFWSKLIGRGYPPPTRWFRWCTSNMKIKPSRAAIESIVREFGSVVLLLGSRKAESSNRSRSMSQRIRNARGMNPHHEIPNAFVLAPISEWSTDDVWEYLFENNPPPWGNPHDEMLGLYRQAGGGECPVVMDLNTPSCGGSRFGCWTCTVVKMDKSMEGFVETGESWMLPLNEFRNWLKVIREDPNLRQKRKRSGELGLGPFTPEARQRILIRLLETEKSLGMGLIKNEEIQYIQNEWNLEFDLRKKAIDIARSFGRDVKENAAMQLSNEEQRLIADVAAELELNEDVIISLLELEQEFPDIYAWGARANLKRRVARILEQAAQHAENATSE